MKRLKREKKKAEMRRAMSVSPYKRIAQMGEMEACYINANWLESGMASIQVIRRNPAGGHAMAIFLVDVWCAGLKDASGRLDVMQEDIDFNLKRARENFELIRIDPEEARKLIAAGIRFSRQNGFRLPPHYDRWINLLGGVGDVAAADLSKFGKDGKLFWIGPLEDLQTRLIGSTVEDFLARPDVEMIAEVTEDELLGDEDEDEDEEDIDEESDKFNRMVETWRQMLLMLAHNFAEEVKQRLTDRGAGIPDQTDAAVQLLMAAQICRDSEQHPEEWKSSGSRAHVAAAGAMVVEVLGAEAKEIPSGLRDCIEAIAPDFRIVQNNQYDKVERWAEGMEGLKNGISKLTANSAENFPPF